jgi:hypothetical protein
MEAPDCRGFPDGNGDGKVAQEGNRVVRAPIGAKRGVLAAKGSRQPFRRPKRKLVGASEAQPSKRQRLQMARVREWTPSQVCEYLTRRNLGQHCSAITSTGVDGEALLGLDSKVLKHNMGIHRLADRRMLLHVVEELQATETKIGLWDQTQVARWISCLFTPGAAAQACSQAEGLAGCDILTLSIAELMTRFGQVANATDIIVRILELRLICRQPNISQWDILGVHDWAKIVGISEKARKLMLQNDVEGDFVVNVGSGANTVSLLGFCSPREAKHFISQIDRLLRNAKAVASANAGRSVLKRGSGPPADLRTNSVPIPLCWPKSPPRSPRKQTTSLPLRWSENSRNSPSEFDRGSKADVEESEAQDKDDRYTIATDKRNESVAHSRFHEPVFQVVSDLQQQIEEKKIGVWTSTRRRIVWVLLLLLACTTIVFVVERIARDNAQPGPGGTAHGDRTSSRGSSWLPSYARAMQLF